MINKVGIDNELLIDVTLPIERHIILAYFGELLSKARHRYCENHNKCDFISKVKKISLH